MKYIITLSRKGRKRAVAVKADSLEEVKATTESLLNINGWTEAELFNNDCITPSMDDGYLLEATAKAVGGKVEWKPTNYRPI